MEADQKEIERQHNKIYRDANPSYTQMHSLEQMMKNILEDKTMSLRERIYLENFLREQLQAVRKDLPVGDPMALKQPSVPTIISAPVPTIVPTTPVVAPDVADVTIPRAETPKKEKFRKLADVLHETPLPVTSKEKHKFERMLEVFDMHPEKFAVDAGTNEIVINGTPIDKSDAIAVVSNALKGNKSRAKPGYKEFASAYTMAAAASPRVTRSKKPQTGTGLKTLKLVKSKSRIPPGIKSKVLRMYR